MGARFAKALPLIPAILAAALASCEDKPRIEGNIIRQVSRPSGEVEAVISDSSGGATVSFSYHVYVRGTAGDDWPQEVLFTYRSGPPAVHWEGKKVLVVSVACGEIWKFANFAGVAPAGGPERIFVKLENPQLDCTAR